MFSSGLKYIFICYFLLLWLGLVLLTDESQMTFKTQIQDYTQRVVIIHVFTIVMVK